jgi:molybdopterin/thiamine biosynthesis adenylyltransferase/rhodanese-related sulfurtransferase
MTEVHSGTSAFDPRRYSRQIILSEVGEAGQRRLKDARVLVVGGGGLGCPALVYLAAAGVGTIGLVENDAVDLSNLHRQILFDTDQVGHLKVDAALNRLHRLNPECRLVRHSEWLDGKVAESLIAGYDLVLDATDNFSTRYLINDAALLLDKPVVSASVFQFSGQLTVFHGSRGPCYRCLYPDAPPEGMVPSCSESGVLGAVPGALGALQAAQAIKLILGVGEPMIGKLLNFDLFDMSSRTLSFDARSDCPCHWRDGAALRALIAARAEPATCDLQMAGDEAAPCEVEAWRGEQPDLLLIDVREAWEREICQIVGSIWIPLGELPKRGSELPTDRRLVVYCHKGGRSRRAVDILKASGRVDVWNLQGGIQAWARSVDTSLAPY